MKQFQDESLATIESPRIALQTRRFGPNANEQEAAIASLFVGMRLGRPLCDSHRELLDQMAPGRAITFMIQGNRYLHPADVELFPMELIASSINHDGQAFYSHRLRSVGPDGIDCRVHTVVLNPGQSAPLVLGFFGPDHELTLPDFENGFFDSALRLREVYASLEGVSLMITERLSVDQAVVVVNRSSGRILAVNPLAITLLGAPESRWLDREFGSLPAEMFSMESGRKINMDNVCEGEFHASVMTLEGTAKERRTFSMEHDLIGQAREKLANITTAASLVQTMTDSGDEPERQLLCDDIASEADTLDSWLTTLNLLRNMHELPVRSISIGQQLSLAIDRINTRVGRNPEIVLWGARHDAEIVVPEESLAHFFEAVMMDHSIGRINGATVVSLTSGQERQQMLITVATTGNDETTVSLAESMWDRCAERMAEEIGIRMERKSSLEHNQLTTEITIETHL